MTSLRYPMLVLLLLLALSVVKATLNLTLQYELREDSPPGTAIGTDEIICFTLCVLY